MFLLWKPLVEGFHVSSKILTAYLSFFLSAVACRLDRSNFRRDGFRLCLGKEIGV